MSRPCRRPADLNTVQRLACPEGIGDEPTQYILLVELVSGVTAHCKHRRSAIADRGLRGLRRTEVRTSSMSPGPQKPTPETRFQMNCGRAKCHPWIPTGILRFQISPLSGSGPWALFVVVALDPLICFGTGTGAGTGNSFFTTQVDLQHTFT